MILIKKMRIEQKFYVRLLVAILVCTVASEIYLIHSISQYALYFLPVPFFFILMGFGLVYTLQHNREQSDQRLVTIYIALKVAKFLAVIILFVAYGFLLKDHLIEIFILIALHYAAYLILETGFFFSFEKSLKKEKNG